MKMKRVLSAFLVLAMLVPVALTGCKKKTEEDMTDTSSIYENVVLNMYILTDKDTDLEQAKKVEIALNEILLPKHRTVVKINYIKEDGAGNSEYWNAIEKAEEEALAYQKNKGNSATEEDVDTSEMSAEERELAEAKNEDEYTRLSKMVFGYSDEAGNKVAPNIVTPIPQLDIFIVDSAEKYVQLANEGHLANLDDFMKNKGKDLKTYIYPTFLDGAKAIADGLYGIPVNKCIGEYEYLVFNKEYLDEYLAFKAANSVMAPEAESAAKNDPMYELRTIDGLEDYLAYIAANKPGVVPLALSEGGVSPQFFEYAGEDGSAYGNFLWEEKSGSYIQTRPTFSTEAESVVKTHFLKLREYRLAGYIPETYVEGTPFAVDIRKGYADSPAKWNEESDTQYVCEIYKRPIATTENTLDSFMVVSSASRNPARAAEIISLFNTDAELANILQYGVADEHYYYTLDDDGVKKVNVKANGGYIMNNDFTGHHYIKLPKMGEVDRSAAFKTQNLDSLIGFTFGFTPNTFIKDELLIEKANAITMNYYEGLSRGEYDVDTVYAEINAQLGSLTVTEAEIDAWVGTNPSRIARRNSEKYESETYDSVKITEQAVVDVNNALFDAEAALERATKHEILNRYAQAVQAPDSATIIATADAVIAEAYAEIESAYNLAVSSVALADVEADKATATEKEAKNFAKTTTTGAREAAAAEAAAADNAKRVRSAKVELNKSKNSAESMFDQIKSLRDGSIVNTAAIDVANSDLMATIGYTSYSTGAVIEYPDVNVDADNNSGDTSADLDTGRAGLDSEFAELVYDIRLQLDEYRGSNDAMWNTTREYYKPSNKNNVVIMSDEIPLKVVNRDEE